MKSTLLALVSLPFFLFSQTEKGVKPITNNQSTNNQTRAVVIGISDYQEKGIPDLRFADKDAEAFANYLRSPAGGSLDNDHLQILTNQNATAGRVAEALDALVEQTKEGDQVIIYFSGHGDVERKTVSQPGFLLCWDSPARVYMGGGTYSLAFLQEIVSTLSTQNKAKVVVVTDACHAGKLAGSQIGGAQLTAANLAKQFSNEVKILSCQPGELSLEGEQWGGGRGIFSYHLVDGLFGLADRNADGQVTLGEIDRYLEDKVTAEAAPQSQVPMLLGNKTERLATVNSQILADLKKAKAGGLAVFAATEGRGFEDEILEKADSSVRQLYFAFKKAIREKRFFPGDENALAGQSADELFVQLAENKALESLRGLMKRNYAAALQDDAQQAMNTWLKADVSQLQCISHNFDLESIPHQLGRAAELLGENHYMYRSLQARKLLFEGIALIFNNPYANDSIGRASIALFQKSSALEPNSPLPWHQMCMAYASKLKMADSAFACAATARNLAPNWILPYADLNVAMLFQKKYDLADQALELAEIIDSLHPLVLNHRARWFSEQPGAENQEMARLLFERYRDSGGAMYSCWHTDYARLLTRMGRVDEAEAEFLKAIEMSAENISARNDLGMLYLNTQRYDQAEAIFLKNIEMEEGLDHTTWNNLGAVYVRQKRYTDAQTALEKCISFDSTFANPYRHLGYAYFKLGHLDAARRTLQKAIALDQKFPHPYFNLALVFVAEGKNPEALDCLEQAILKKIDFERLLTEPDLAPLRSLPEWKALMKKHFPDKVKD